MNAQKNIVPEDVAIAGSWAESEIDRIERSRRAAWIVASVSAVVAFLLAVALVVLLPLKTIEPYTLLVDRQTGNIEALAPLDEQLIAPDTALTRSFLVQYVIARESFDADSFDRDYGRTTLWSTGDARQRYVAQMQPNNPLSPLAYMPRNGVIRTEIRSVSPLGADRALVRFSTVRSDPGAQPQQPEHWAAVVQYGFSKAPMSEADRLLNPLGFQVTSYRRDAETLPEIAPQFAEPAPPRAVDSGSQR
ncbi:MAG: hypothetical protein K5799_05000 [Erythrobacter sp.]|nr:hypothetical protein [Erythrobacter sp.]